ncbi:MAG: hypothetical protein AB8H03_19745 [Saprospiraceae bacterium]
MKNSNILTRVIVVIFLQIPFFANAQSGTVAFKVEQPTKSINNYSSDRVEVGIVKTKTYIKLKYRKGELLGYQKKKQYEFGPIDKPKSITKVKTTEFKSFIKKNKYQLSGNNKDL